MKQHQHRLQLFAAPAVLLSTCMLLVGCCTAPPAMQTVYVPVHTPCVQDVPTAPVYEFDNLPLDAADGQKVLALARDWLRGRKYEGEIDAVVSGCL
jgi:hypothetical protein